MADPTRVENPGSGEGARSGRNAGNWRQWMLGVAALLLAIIAIQNWQTVEIRILFIETDTPLILGLLIAGALGAIIGYAAPVLRSHRKGRGTGES